MEIQAAAERHPDSEPTCTALVTRLISVALQELAETRACAVSDLEAEWEAGGGDIEIESLEGICVIAALEEELKQKLPGLENLPTEQITSIRSLIALVSEYLSLSDSATNLGTAIAS